MEYDDEEGLYTLSNGRKLYANCGILGLTPRKTGNPERLTITEGYDGGINLDRDFDLDDDAYEPVFTAEERNEVAEYMIALWLEWSVQKPPR